ncbi:MAG: hypothetical protein WBM53_00770 [Maribacter sp.]
MNKSIFILTLLLITINRFSQDENIYKKWILLEQLDCNDISQSISADSKGSIEFKNNQTTEIILNLRNFVSNQSFKVDSNRIILDNRELIIEKLLKDSLVFKEQFVNSCIKFIMISSDLIAMQQKQKFMINNSGFVFFVKLVELMSNIKSSI